jgi:hypothetical protein
MKNNAAWRWDTNNTRCHLEEKRTRHGKQWNGWVDISLTLLQPNQMKSNEIKPNDMT